MNTTKHVWIIRSQSNLTAISNNNNNKNIDNYNNNCNNKGKVLTSQAQWRKSRIAQVRASAASTVRTFSTKQSNINSWSIIIWIQLWVAYAYRKQKWLWLFTNIWTAIILTVDVIPYQTLSFSLSSVFMAMILQFSCHIICQNATIVAFKGPCVAM